MNTERLYSRGEPKTGPGNTAFTRDVWLRVMTQFPIETRYHVANLAAHGWDVSVIGDRLLISNKWSGGHWITKDGKRTEISGAEWDAFYPRINGRSDHRQTALVLDVPAPPASGGEGT